jgi:hypothetical protein
MLNYNVSLYVDIPNTHIDTVYTQALYAIFPGDFPDKIMYIVFVSHIRLHIRSLTTLEASFPSLHSNFRAGSFRLPVGET